MSATRLMVPALILKFSNRKHPTSRRCTAHTPVNWKARDTFVEILKHSHHKGKKTTMKLNNM